MTKMGLIQKITAADAAFSRISIDIWNKVKAKVMPTTPFMRKIKQSCLVQALFFAVNRATSSRINPVMKKRIKVRVMGFTL